MASVTFDTLKFTKRLEGAGLPPEHPEAISDAFAEATGTELVKTDHLKVEIEAAKNDIIKWMAALLLAQAGLLTALVKPLSLFALPHRTSRRPNLRARAPFRSSTRLS